jgi:hypothetical protein
MKTNQLLNVKDKIDLINTSESYTQNFFLIERNLVMPLINLDLIGEVIGNDKRVKIEFVYLILEDVSQINFIGQDENGKEIIGELILQSEEKTITDWFGFNAENYGYELKINFEELKMFIPKVSRIEDKWWSPWETPNFKKNIEDSKINNFFQLEMIKGNLDLEISKMKPVTFNESDSKKKFEIRENWSNE